MVPPDHFSDSPHDMVRDALPVHYLGSARGGYAELVGQNLPGKPPIIKSRVNRAVEHCRKDRPSDLEGRMNAFARPKR